MKFELDEYHDRVYKIFLSGLIDEKGNILQKLDDKDKKEELEIRFLKYNCFHILTVGRNLWNHAIV